MPWGSVVLKPGVDVDRTPTLNVAGYSASRLIRYKAGLAQKMGGWERYYQFAVGGVPRAMHAWQDLNENKHLAIGTTSTLGVMTDGEMTLITPQAITTNGAPQFSTTSGSTAVVVNDFNISNVTTYDAVEFKTPVSAAGVVLSGVYAIDLVLSSTTYQITAAGSAPSTRAAASITGATQANPCTVTTAAPHGFVDGDIIYIDNVVGMTQLNQRVYSIANSTSSTFELAGVDASAYSAYSSNGLASSSAVPFFTTTVGSSLVTVLIASHGLSVGETINLPISTTLQTSKTTMTIASPGVISWFYGSHGLTGNEAITFTTTGALPGGITAGVTYYVLSAGLTSTAFRISATPGGSAINTSGSQSGIHTATIGSASISGTCTVIEVTSINTFTVAIASEAQVNSGVMMNAGSARLEYRIGLGPSVSLGTGYSVGTYSSGSYSTGASSTTQEGDPIAAVDWSHDNWGSTLLSNPEGGGIYEWTQSSGFETARLVPGAPPFNNGIFVAAPAQILIAWGSTERYTVGSELDPLTYSWSDQLDYAFWEAGVINPTTGLFSQAGSARIPTGSRIMAGMQAPQQALLWTDLDLWAINYIGNPTIGTFGQTKISSSCGAIGKHAVAQLGNIVMWMGRSNFFALSGSGVNPIPCPVWDAVFQDLDVVNAWKTTACANTPFNEIAWMYPSLSGGSGEPDAYVKLNITDGSWDIGPTNSMPRSAWIDQSVLGMPIGASPAGIVYQQETGTDADGQPMEWSFRTGYWMISEGEDVAFVDRVIPDFKFGTYGGASNASIQITLYSVMYPGGDERSYGPYTVTSSSTTVSTRLRGRQMAIEVAGSDLGTWARLGRLRYRWAPSGRL